MNRNNIVERHPVSSFIFFLIAGFSLGWIGYRLVQRVASVTPFDEDELKMLERIENQEKEELVRKENEVKNNIRLLGGYLDSNKPNGNNYVRNIELDPPSPSKLQRGKTITVRLFYVTEGAQIYISGDEKTFYEGEGFVYGQGTTARWIMINEPDKLKMIKIHMIRKNGDEIYSMKIPVDYTIR